MIIKVLALNYLLLFLECGHLVTQILNELAIIQLKAWQRQMTSES